MQLDVNTAFLVSGSILAIFGLVIFFYSLIKRENRPFVWAAAASIGFAVQFSLMFLRGKIPDFFSIIVANALALFILIAFYELFSRILSVKSNGRFVGPCVLIIQSILFVWYTYYQPDFQARVVVINCALGIMCLNLVKLILSKAGKGQRLVHFIAVMPLSLMILFSIMVVTPFALGFGTPAKAFQSHAYALFIVFYGVSAAWICLSALFIVNSRLQTQVAEMALIDPLTGAFNRRALREMSEREIAQAQRNGTALSLIISDLDHFKKINDQYGHLAGDAVLTHTVNLLKNTLRAGDILARYGGEEFVAVLPGADMQRAHMVAERLRQTCAANPLEFESQPIPVTLSFGVAGYTNNRMGYETLVRHADEALYRAKEEGRDRIALFKRP